MPLTPQKNNVKAKNQIYIKVMRTPRNLKHDFCSAYPSQLDHRYLEVLRSELGTSLLAFFSLEENEDISA